MEESIKTEQLMRFLKLEEELQRYQNGNSRIEYQVLVRFLHGTHEDRERDITRLESWLNRSWRTGRKPSEIPYSELVKRRKSQR